MATAPRNGLATNDRGIARCFWGMSAPDYVAYHDKEWGFPVKDDTRLFEKICLEGFQSGLSWLTILRKRDNFRSAFAGFDIDKVARFGPAKVDKLLQDAAIVRHRGKIQSTINNAKRARDLRDEFGSLAAYFWAHEPADKTRPKRMTWAKLKTMAKTGESTTISRDLKKRGWTFVGPTTAYAFMQAMGLVNDHVEGCVVRDKCTAARARFRVPRAR